MKNTIKLFVAAAVVALAASCSSKTEETANDQPATQEETTAPAVESDTTTTTVPSDTTAVVQ